MTDSATDWHVLVQHCTVYMGTTGDNAAWRTCANNKLKMTQSQKSTRALFSEHIHQSGHMSCLCKEKAHSQCTRLLRWGKLVYSQVVNSPRRGSASLFVVRRW